MATKINALGGRSTSCRPTTRAGLHLAANDKGMIYAWWAIFQSLLPVITGGFADRFGYKRTLGLAVSLMMTGYLIPPTTCGSPSP